MIIIMNHRDHDHCHANDHDHDHFPDLSGYLEQDILGSASQLASSSHGVSETNPCGCCYNHYPKTIYDVLAQKEASSSSLALQLQSHYPINKEKGPRIVGVHGLPVSLQHRKIMSVVGNHLSLPIYGSPKSRLQPPPQQKWNIGHWTQTIGPFRIIKNNLG